MKLAAFHTQPKPHPELQQAEAFTFHLLLLCRKYHVIQMWKETKSETWLLASEAVLCPAWHGQLYSPTSTCPPPSQVKPIKRRAVRFLKASRGDEETNGAGKAGVSSETCYSACTISERLDSKLCICTLPHNFPGRPHYFRGRTREG